MNVRTHALVIAVGSYDFRETDQSTGVITETHYPYIAIADGVADSERFTCQTGVTLPDVFTWIDADVSYDTVNGKTKKRCHGWAKSAQQGPVKALAEKVAA